MPGRSEGNYATQLRASSVQAAARTTNTAARIWHQDWVRNHTTVSVTVQAGVCSALVAGETRIPLRIFRGSTIKPKAGKSQNPVLNPEPMGPPRDCGALAQPGPPPGEQKTPSTALLGEGKSREGPEERKGRETDQQREREAERGALRFLRLSAEAPGRPSRPHLSLFSARN